MMTVGRHAYGVDSANIGFVDQQTMEDMTMNKSELVESLAVKKSLTLKWAEEVIDTVFDSMSDALLSGDRIEIRGFGSFVVKEYDAYIGRNPKTGEPIHAKAKKLPFFKVGKDMKEKVFG
jgi:integration host factor subunit beta